MLENKRINEIREEYYEEENLEKNEKEYVKLVEEDVYIINEDEFSDVLLEDELDEGGDDANVCDKIDDSDEKIVSNINQDESESDLDVYFKFGTNNHKLEGKHSLKRDTILNGKIDESPIEGDEIQYIQKTYYDSAGNNIDADYDYGGYDTLSIEKGSIFEDESRRGEDMLNKRKLSQEVYDLLKNNTDLDFNANRRKPNKEAFNSYYRMLINNINKQYSKCDIFVELSYYFTDNTFNMYKLLDKKYATEIIMELREKGYLKNLDLINFM